MRFYNYVYLDPRKPGRYFYDGLALSFLFEPFYVGKGSGERLLAHLAEMHSKKRTLKINKIKSILRENHDLRSHIIQINDGLSSKQAFDEEIHMIKTIGRISLKTGPLTNMTSGGEGTPEHSFKTIEKLKSMHPSKESNQKRSETLKGRPSPMKGKESKFKGVTRDSEILQKAWDTRHQRTYAPVKLNKFGEKNSKAKTFIFISPTGDTYSIKGGFRPFCLKHELKICRMLNHFDRDWICFKIG